MTVFFFSKYGSKGLLALLSVSAKGLLTSNLTCLPQVTKNTKVLGKIVTLVQILMMKFHHSSGG